jgi:hypothetical protein
MHIPTRLYSRFRDVSMNYPGSSHDALVFKNSNLFKKCDELIPIAPKQLGHISIPLMLTGDPAYPFLPWLIKGYTGNLPEEESFNCHLSSGRMAVENAFGRLKARWRILLKRIDINYQFVPQIVCAFCILHNFVETNKGTFNSGWLRAVEEAEARFPQPLQRSANINANMVEVRNHLKHYMALNYPLRQSTRK